jgi:lipopolysaccharide export system permease protein
MTTLGRYYIRRIVPPFLVTLSVVLMALSLERLLRIVEEVTQSGAPPDRAFEMLGYLVPHYLELAIPAALFLAVLMATRRLQASDELAAMQAAGVPVWRLLRPLLGISLVLTGVMLVNGGYVQPHARYAFKTRMHEITETSVTLRLQPGVFQRLGNRAVVRADEVSQGGRQLRNFFAVVDKADGSRNVITAGRARIRPNGGTMSGLAVELHDGTIVRHGGAAKAGSVAFDTYLWEPPTDVVAPYGPRGENEQELTLFELMRPNVAARTQNADPRDVVVERHLRVLKPLSLPVLAVLAVPLSLLGGGRTGHAYGFVLGVGLLVLYQKTVGFAEAFAEDGVLPTAPALWTPYAALVLLTLLLLWHRAETAGRSLLGWLGKRRRPGVAAGAALHPAAE